MSNSSAQLTELELRITTLIRKYREQKTVLDHKLKECEALLARNSEQEEKISRLEKNLSIATISGGTTSPEAQQALKGLDVELEQIMEVIDECITLLAGRVE